MQSLDGIGIVYFPAVAVPGWRLRERRMASMRHVHFHVYLHVHLHDVLVLCWRVECVGLLHILHEKKRNV